MLVSDIIATPQALFEDVFQRYPQLLKCRTSLIEAFDILVETFKNNHKLLICGNGGSSSDADHIAGELLKSFKLKRLLSDAEKERLPKHLGDNLQGALPVIPLSSFPGLSSAYWNDCDGDYTYAQLVHGLAQPGDTLLSISTSGNSQNILHATEYAKYSGIRTIALTGHNGGQLRDLVDVAICVPETETYKIQELHLPIYHTLSLMLEATFFELDAR